MSIVSRMLKLEHFRMQNKFPSICFNDFEETDAWEGRSPHSCLHQGGCWRLHQRSPFRLTMIGSFQQSRSKKGKESNSCIALTVCQIPLSALNVLFHEILPILRSRCDLPYLHKRKPKLKKMTYLIYSDVHDT